MPKSKKYSLFAKQQSTQDGSFEQIKKNPPSYVLIQLCASWLAVLLKFSVFGIFSDSGEPERRYNIPVLSGTAYVGQLYDAKKDQLIPDQFLWKRDEMSIVESNVTNVFFETKIEESQLDRMNNMDIDASMKLSFMGGLISV